MSIRYALFANRLTGGVGDYMAHVQKGGTADLDMVVERVMEQGSHLSRGDALAMMEELLVATQSLLLDGYRVDLGGIVHLHTSIKGKLVGLTNLLRLRRRYEIGGV